MCPLFYSVLSISIILLILRLFVTNSFYIIDIVIKLIFTCVSQPLTPTLTYSQVKSLLYPYF